MSSPSPYDDYRRYGDSGYRDPGPYRPGPDYREDPGPVVADEPGAPPSAVRRDTPAARVAAGRLWATGAATAVVAVLAALVATLAVRGVLGVAIFAPRHDGAMGDATTGWLAVTAAFAALVATGVLHLLLVTTPRPRTFFAWIVVLATLAFALLPFTTGVSQSAKLGTAAVYLIIGLAIGGPLYAAAPGVLRGGVVRGGVAYRDPID
jgi:hypothetical protein